MSRTRTFLAAWTLALVLVAAFAALGFWQLRRGSEKQAMLDRASAVLEDRGAVPLDAALDPARAAGYDWSRGSGRFATQPPILLDNQQRNGRVGVRVFRLFHPDDGQGELLVDLGWLPVPGDRTLPAAALAAGLPRAGRLELRGLLAPPPSPGLALGEPMSRRAISPTHEAWLATRIDTAAVERAVGSPVRTLAPRVLRLDPALPIGFERDLVVLPNTLPPEKHRGYAVQWFGLAIAVLVTALILTYRRARP